MERRYFSESAHATAWISMLRAHPAAVPSWPACPSCPSAGFHVSAAETPVPVSFQTHVLTLSLKIKNTNFQLDSLQSARSLGFPASLGL